MRIIRLGALVGSVVLLVATTISMVNRRDELRRDLDRDVVTAVILAEQSIEAVAVRAASVVALTSGGTTPDDLTRSFGPTASACVETDGDETCSDVDLFTLAAFGEAAAASATSSTPAAMVDESTDSMLAVSRRAATGALLLPPTVLIDPGTEAELDALGADVSVAVSADTGVAEGDGIATIDGRRVVTTSLGLPDDGGTLDVSVSIVDDSGLSGDGLTFYLALLGLGTVLMALAGWTFLLDRRSLERRATTDELTGLVNRREFERQTEEALLTAQRFNTGVCLLLIDLNGFKQINDTLGHQFGDLVLQAGAQRLRAAVRDSDVVGRWGGDEFVILLPGVEDASAVRSSAERIGGQLGNTPIVADVSISASIGAALFPRHGATLDDLVRAADMAMYSAKTTGVTHRLADLAATEMAASIVGSHGTDGYDGPERRRHED